MELLLGIVIGILLGAVGAYVVIPRLRERIGGG